MLEHTASTYETKGVYTQKLHYRLGANPTGGTRDEDMKIF